MPQNREFYRLKTKMDIIATRLELKSTDETDYRLRFKEEAIEMDSFDVTVLDLSVGGMRAEGKMKITLDQHAYFDIPLQEDAILRVQGVFKECSLQPINDNRYTYRIQFEHLNVGIENKLFAFINHLQSEVMKAKDVAAYDHGDTISITDQILLKHGERRVKTDWIKLWPGMASFIGWGILLFIGLCILAARPFANDPVSQLLRGQGRSMWDHELLYKAYFSSLFLGVFSFVAILVDLTRQNRKGDWKHKSLVVQCMLSLIIVLYFILALGLGQRGINKDAVGVNINSETSTRKFVQCDLKIIKRE